MKILILALLLSAVSSLASDKLGDPFINIEYKPFFHEDVYLTLHKNEDSVLVRGAAYGKRDDGDTIKRFKTQKIEEQISLETYQTLRRYFTSDKAYQTFSEPDLRSGTDGSAWTVSLHRGGYSVQYNVWTPTYDESKRYDHFVELMKRVFHESGVDISDEAFY